MPYNIGVLISGGGTNLQSIIDACEKSEIDGKVTVVISDKSSAYGLERAKNHDIDAVFVSKKSAGSDEKYNENILLELKKRDVDMVVLAGYLKVVGSNIVEEYRDKIINIHPSLIPSFCGKGYYGEKVHKAVIESGVKFTGATVHFVDEGVDTGRIIAQKIVEVAPEDDANSIQKKVLKEEHKLIVEVTKALCENRVVKNERTSYIK